MRMAPTANVVAMLEPETAAKIRQVSTHVHASPPCMPPTIDLAKATRRCDMPPISIKFPASMKNGIRSEEHTSELQSLMRISYAVFCLKKKNKNINIYNKS